MALIPRTQKTKVFIAIIAMHSAIALSWHCHYSKQNKKQR